MDVDEFRAAARGWLAQAEIPAVPLDLDERFAVLRRWQRTLRRSVAELLGPFRVAPGSRPPGLDSGRWVHDHCYSRAASIYGGTAQIQRTIVAERLLGLPVAEQMVDTAS